MSNWQPYQILQAYPDLKREQVNSLVGTGLKLDEYGQEFTYLPFSKEMEIERNCRELIDAIVIEDNEVEICSEVYFTTKIEGAKMTLQRTYDIHNGAKVDAANYVSEKMVENAFKATKLLNLYTGKKLTNDIIYQVWLTLSDDVCDNRDAEGILYRSKDVYVGNTQGIEPDRLEQVMSYWIDYFNSEEDNDRPVYKASLLHYAYERIHPFCDCNGRLGRLLMHYYLIEHLSDKVKGISCTTDICRQLEQYYTTLSDSSNAYFDCTPFLEYMMDSINRTLARVYIVQKTGCSIQTYETIARPEYLLTKQQCDNFIPTLKQVMRGTK